MKTKIGHMACPDCGEKVAVKKNEHETLSYSCDECDGSGYCKKTEGRYVTWLKRIAPIAGLQSTGMVARKVDDKPAPAPAVKKSVTIV